MQTISIIFKSFTWSRIWYLLWMEDEIIDWSNLPAYLQCELLPIYMHTVGQNLAGEAPKLCKSNALFQIKVPFSIYKWLERSFVIRQAGICGQKRKNGKCLTETKSRWWWRTQIKLQFKITETVYHCRKCSWNNFFQNIAYL